MSSYLTLLIALLSFFNSELPPAKTIVARSIDFHDPNSKWGELQVYLEFTETRPRGDDLHTWIEIDNLRGNFCMMREMNKMHVERHITKDSCFYNIDEYDQLTDKEIEEETKLTKFDGKEAYQVKVTYDAETGSDIWFFYFDPANYAMIGYRFYHNLEKGDGEYILLKGSELVFGLNIPKARSWYTHKDSTLLGTDILTSFEGLSHTHY